MPNCFQIYFRPIYLYIKKVSLIAQDNDYALTISSVFVTGLFQLIEEVLQINFFGVPNLILILVIGTVIIDAHYGIKASVKKSEELYNEAKQTSDEIKKRRLKRKAKLLEFDPKKLQYTGFKCLTLLGYLFFAKNILASDSDEGPLVMVLSITTEIIIKAPVAIFWYYDFKSIGDNSEYNYKKKAPIFIIVEKIFEPKISNFFKNDSDE